MQCREKTLVFFTLKVNWKLLGQVLEVFVSKKCRLEPSKEMNHSNFEAANLRNFLFSQSKGIALALDYKNHQTDNKAQALLLVI